ncbi:ABC transporter substrate-binding protein [Agaribacterium sp. ZY112]|uniref:ABC transporter substrate-binding protein n=1 Tax=Agaribacterium sp. ZY112 TaxID=3233574 RepID=UPI0035242BC5
MCFLIVVPSVVLAAGNSTAVDAEKTINKPKVLKVAIYADGGTHRGHLRRLVKEFEQKNPNIDVHLMATRGIGEYNDKVEYWIRSGSGPDLIYWYGGQRLNQFDRKGKVTDLSAFWSKNNLHKDFPLALRQASMHKGRMLAIPITYYFWALYYHEPSIKAMGLDLPTNWVELMYGCTSLREQGIDLFTFGSQTAWATHGWFDYFNLRVNGLDFYRGLLAGKIAYTDVRVHTALSYWKQLLESDCFNANHGSYNLWQSFPRIYHGLSAMSLIDGVPQGTAQERRQGLRLMPFPSIVEGIPRYTVAPVNVFFVPAYVEPSPELDTLLLYIASADFQSEFNKSIFRPPAHIKGKTYGDSRTQAMQDAIRDSAGGIQYLDRDTEYAFAKEVPAILVSFLEHRDIHRTTAQLEALRQKVFIETDK